MEDLDYAGINFGAIVFLYLFAVFYLLKLNSKWFAQKTQDQNSNTQSSCLDQILEAFVFWPKETKKNHNLICIEKVANIFVIFTNQEVAYSLFEQQQNFKDDLQVSLYKYLYIPLICFGGFLLQKVFYYMCYSFYKECIFKQLEKKYPKTSKFAFSDPRSRSMFFFGYVIANLVVIVIVFSDSANLATFGSCILSALIGSGIQIFGPELLFVIVFVQFFQLDYKLYTILFQQKKPNVSNEKIERYNQENQTLR
ncbi:unnamed protein product (macronuclear) [Paramecium tetraurelia]|uniref:Transmembrane protein n=1 Tax=Paramecium tetraurelia TaxID=5888 RepID=A0DZW5_PARTE|nr:uncharacterized protein GSPATT00021750001 [Paramecium tetraurelia]CAK88582.1 unnamed protein product [Paramecium tetraurelia]|eukprot:XP_001455979.1 hypothetical protein (macronuclear) [Paramecium tetraurelia strain d4-2]